MNIEWSPEARSQLAEIVERYNALSNGAGKRRGDAIGKAVRRLADHPLSGRMVPEHGSPRVREVIVGDFRVMYETFPDRVEVFAVVSAAMDLRPSAE